jgi:hypothetical protein
MRSYTVYIYGIFMYIYFMNVTVFDFIYGILWLYLRYCDHIYGIYIYFFLYIYFMNVTVCDYNYGIFMYIYFMNVTICGYKPTWTWSVMNYELNVT